MRIIKGHYIVNGGLCERGELLVEQTDDGVFRDPYDGTPLKAREVRVTETITGVEVTHPHGAWVFAPDRTEMARVGWEYERLSAA